MLDQAKAGDIESGLPIVVGRNAGLTLSESQLQRLAQAADRAEAEGATRAIVLIDGMALTMDVAIRTITGKADLTATGVVSGADAVITVAPAEPPARASRPAGASLPANAPLTQNRSLMEILASRGGAEPT